MPNAQSPILGPEPGPEGLPLQALRGVGPGLSVKLASLKIATVQDLFLHLPIRYQDRTRVRSVGELRGGEDALLELQIDHAQVVFRPRRSLLLNLSDKTGTVLIRFFHFSNAQQQNLKIGAILQVFGTVRVGNAGLEMVHPEYRILENGKAAIVEAALTPVYPVVSGIQQRSLQKLIHQALDQHLLGVREFLPRNVLEKFSLQPIQQAILSLHRPTTGVSVSSLNEARHPAVRRLVLEELLAHHLSLLLRREKRNLYSARPLLSDGSLRNKFLHRLPFALTGDQQSVIREIDRDLSKGYPMMRLLQGDVGSGKTLVAAMVALAAVEAGFQCAIMAPTEILAEQHYLNFVAWFNPIGIEVNWLTGRHKAKARRSKLEQIRSGFTGVAIGTHALFQEEVKFQNLGLIIIDEQHRFGVQQRLALQDKGISDLHRPHQLIMTATPIPRSLAMTFYADLDSSVIKELPPGRSPIETAVIPSSRRDQVIERIQSLIDQGQQVYWVCSLIDESEKLQLQTASGTELKLKKSLPDVRIGLIHGRMNAQQKELIMGRFKTGELQLLVATTVIEVGVDVPNASLMVIENAERLGLAQLHQLRGRVGRGMLKSTCLLMYDKPLSELARSRLQVMRSTTDGFVIAQKDLEIRGPGEFMGTKQAGSAQMKIADLGRDQALFPVVAEIARVLLDQAPERVPDLMRRWLGDSVEYSNV